MAQWKIKVVPSGPCRMVGFVEKVGAIPSTCGKDGASIAVKINSNYRLQFEKAVIFASVY